MVWHGMVILCWVHSPVPGGSEEGPGAVRGGRAREEGQQAKGAPPPIFLSLVLAIYYLYYRICPPLVVGVDARVTGGWRLRAAGAAGGQPTHARRSITLSLCM